MSEAVNLKRARITELTGPIEGKQARLLMTCAVRGDFFRIVAVNGNPDHRLVGSYWSADEVTKHADITVLAEFPVTLADLIPDGCEAFRFKRKYRVELTATKDTGTEADIWVIGGMQGHWRDLNKLSADLGVDPDTVVPLVITVHSDYVEERR